MIVIIPPSETVTFLPPAVKGHTLRNLHFGKSAANWFCPNYPILGCPRIHFKSHVTKVAICPTELLRSETNPTIFIPINWVKTSIVRFRQRIFWFILNLRSSVGQMTTFDRDLVFCDTLREIVKLNIYLLFL